MLPKITKPHPYVHWTPVLKTGFEEGKLSMTKCKSCGVELTSVFPGPQRRRGDKQHQFFGALHVNLSGQYGEFIDGYVNFTLCEPCAIEFLEVINMSDIKETAGRVDL